MADNTYVMAIDQGTTSTRAMIFDHAGTVVATDQLEHEQIFPKAGWVEHDALEIWQNSRKVIGGALAKANFNSKNIAAVGITNQRETTVVWDKSNGQPIYNAIVWQDTRTQAIIDRLSGGDLDKYKETVGLPLATYFSGPKVAWILENVEGARERAEAGELLFGTMDTWVLWNLTGGAENNGVHVTDVTNGSRTMLMNLKTLFDVPARESFRLALGSDDVEWERGKGWAFQQAAGLGWYYRESNPPMADLGVTSMTRILESSR